MQGKVIEREEESSFGSITEVLTLKKVTLSDNGKDWKPVEGNIQCRRSRENPERVSIGQWVELRGTSDLWEEASNPGQFDLRQWYRNQGISGRVSKCRILRIRGKTDIVLESLRRLRLQAAERFAKGLGEKDGSVLAAMLLGEKKEMDGDTKSLYQKNGISHILAISGLHITLLGMFLYKLLSLFPLPSKIIATVSGVIMVIYCVMTGASVSSVRAVLMFLLLLTAKITGRAYDSLSALGFAAILQSIFNSRILLDGGFQLSFLAVLGVNVMTPVLHQLFPTENKAAKALLLSVGVSLVTLPVLLYHYGTYPWYSILLNLFVVPAMSLLLLLGIVFLFLAEVRVLSLLPVWGIKGILRYYEICCKVAEWLPFQNGYFGRPSMWVIILYYGMLTVLVILVKKKNDIRMKLWVLCALLLLTLDFPGNLQITMLDVGQGDGIVIKNDNGHVYLSDFGSSSVNQVGKRRLLPFLKQQGMGKIEGIFVSHLDADHVNGIAELLAVAKEEHLRIRHLFLPVSLQRGEASEEVLQETVELKALAETARAEVIFLSTGDRIQDGSLEWKCLAPEKGDGLEGNEGSLVLMLTYKEFSMLFTGDVEGAGEEELISELQKEESIDVLKVAHHGSKNSTGEELLEIIQPRAALISAGKNNRYGHPHKETLERLQESGSQVYQTSEWGAITIETDGKKMKVEGFCDLTE